MVPTGMVAGAWKWLGSEVALRRVAWRQSAGWAGAGKGPTGTPSGLGAVGGPGIGGTALGSAAGKRSGAGAAPSLRAALGRTTRPSPAQAAERAVCQSPSLADR